MNNYQYLCKHHQSDNQTTCTKCKYNIIKYNAIESNSSTINSAFTEKIMSKPGHYFLCKGRKFYRTNTRLHVTEKCVSVVAALLYQTAL